MPNEDTLLHLTVTDQSAAPVAAHLGAWVTVTYDRDAYTRDLLNELFGRVVRYDLWEALVARGWRAVQREVVELADRYSPQYVLCPLSMFELDWSTLVAIRSRGAFVLAWAADDTSRFDNYSRWWTGCVDYFLTSNPAFVKKYERLGARAVYVPCAASPELFQPSVTVRPPLYDITFVGAPIANRVAAVAALREAGLHVRTFGRGWGPLLTLEDMAEVFRRSRINLNFSGSYADCSRKEIKGRVFEITMAGGFLLTENAPSLSDLYVPFEELVPFDSVGDAVTLCRRYLADETGRLQVAAAGQARAAKSHTWRARLEETFSKIAQDIAARGRPAAGAEWVAPAPESEVAAAAAAYHYQWAKARRATESPLWLEEVCVSIDYQPRDLALRAFSVIGRLPIGWDPVLLSSKRACVRLLRPVCRKVAGMTRAKMPRRESCGRDLQPKESDRRPGAV